MKNFFVTLAAFSLALLIGCQENSITDPIANESSNKIQAETPDTYLHGTILLKGVLCDPYPVGNSFYRIDGEIEYTLTLFYYDPAPPASQRSVGIHLKTNAELRHVCTVCSPSEFDVISGFIEDVSEAYVAIGGNFVSLYEKTFKILGREDGMVLKCRFLVTSEEMKLSAMWLALPNNLSAAEETY